LSALNRVGKKEIRDLLGKGWLTHDGMWFYHTQQELGVEKANILNKAAIRSLAPIEIKRVKKAFERNRSGSCRVLCTKRNETYSSNEDGWNY